MIQNYKHKIESYDITRTKDVNTYYYITLFLQQSYKSWTMEVKIDNKHDQRLTPDKIHL